MAESLYERIGADAAVSAVVDLFYEKIMADASLSPVFKDTAMDKQKVHMKKFLGFAFGGPNEYSGADMRSAHAKVLNGGHPTEEVFGVVAGVLVTTLKELNVPAKEIDEIVAIATSVKGDVCGL